MTPHPHGPRHFLKSIGFRLDKSPHQLDQMLLRSISAEYKLRLQELLVLKDFGVGSIDDLYAIPQTLQQASILFSRDWQRAASTLNWFRSVVSKTSPNSVIELGCGAGFLLKYLQICFPDLRLQGIDSAANLTRIASTLIGQRVLSGDYLNYKPDNIYDLIISDFGFEPGRLPPSRAPHSTARVGNSEFCPGCSNDLERQIKPFMESWRRWGGPSARLALVGRIANFGSLKAFALAAKTVDWEVDIKCSAVINVSTYYAEVERFPALMFRPRDQAKEPTLIEDLETFYVSDTKLWNN
jgi:hypothetical protein